MACRCRKQQQETDDSFENGYNFSINLVEYTFQNVSGFISKKNTPSANSDPEEADCIKKPFHAICPHRLKSCRAKPLLKNGRHIFPTPRLFVKTLLDPIYCFI